MIRRLGALLDDILLLALLAATVAHIAGFMQQYEESWLWPAAWLQALAIDMAILRASYIYKVTPAAQARRVALIAVALFSAVSFLLNTAYYLQAGAHFIVAVPMAAFFPVAVTLLSYLRAVRDVVDDRRARRLTGRAAGHIETAKLVAVRRSDTTGQTVSEARTELKQKVAQLRSQGRTLRQISEETGVPRSTISGWLQSQENRASDTAE